MLRFRFCIAAGMMLVLGCTATRKISTVGVREISSVRTAQVVSARRLHLSDLQQPPKECPADFVKTVQNLALEDVDFPSCPESLVNKLQTLLPILHSEERTAVEEAVSSQCRSLGSSADGSALDAVFPPNELRNLAARYPDGSAESTALKQAQEGITYLIDHHLPLDRWVRQNGGYLLSEEVVANLDKLINVRKCKFADEEVDSSFQMIRGLEDLDRILIESEQKRELRQMLHGLYLVQDRKIEEFFRP